jgi:glutamate carboxypeptidase
MIYMLLEALRGLAPQVFEGTRWIVCLDASEEALSTDFGALCLQRFPDDTAACLVFEGGTIDARAYPVVTARKGRAAYKVNVEGKAAHAGNNHAQGANAIVQMAHTIHEIAALTDYEKQLTFNVGKVKGGSVINRVPHQAEARVEMRAFSPQVFEEGVARMLALNGEGKVSSTGGYHCKVSVEMVESTAPWPPNPGSESLFSLWDEAGASLGMRVIREKRGGLSDGNLLWRRFPTLDGLGPAGENAHCSERSADGSKEQEYVLASSFVPKALLNYAAILNLAAGQSQNQERGGS